MKLISKYDSMYSLNIPFRALISLPTKLLLASFTVISLGASLKLPAFSEEIIGPPNLLKTLPNPFGRVRSDQKNNGEPDDGTLGLIEIAPSSAVPQARRSLLDRINRPTMILPDRLILGKSAEFQVKGPVGSWVAIAMADKDKGAKPIGGHILRLGPDRKVMAVGQIPEGGTLSLYVEAPVQGDLVGSQLYFEAAIWSRPDFKDLQIASCVTPQRFGREENGVIVAADVEVKKQGLFVLDPKMGMNRNLDSLGSGR